MLRRRAVELRPGRVTLLAQAGDENLVHFNPFAFRDGASARLDVIEHIRNALHRRDGMLEFGHARVSGVGVRVHQTGQD